MSRRRTQSRWRSRRINDAGGVNGRPIEVIIEDDATDEAQAVSATTKLIEQDEVVAIIGATGTGQSMAMRGDDQPRDDSRRSPWLAERSSPAISIRWSSRRRGRTRWSCRTCSSYLQEQGVTKIGLIADSGGFGKDGVAVIEGATADYGIEIVANETFNPGDTDMSAQLTKIKGTDAEAVVMWTAGSEAAIIAPERGPAADGHAHLR